LSRIEVAQTVRAMGGGGMRRARSDDGESGAADDPHPGRLREQHQKGTHGFTEEYLANLHRTLHQRNHEPEPEHTHPGAGEPDEQGEHEEPAPS
jgi:hypothetical protein